MTRRIIGFALATVLYAPVAGATDLHVSPTGSGTACTPGSPCGLDQANAVAQPGDVIHMANGSYIVAPIPARSGNVLQNIEYRGNPNDRTAVRVPGFINSSREYVTWRYFKTTSDVRITPNCQATSGCGGPSTPFRNLRLIGLSIQTGLYFAGTSYSLMDSCEIVPDYVHQGYFWLSPNDAGYGGSPEPTTNNVFSNNKITLNTGIQEDAFSNGTGLLFAINDSPSQLPMWNTFERNVITVVFRREAAPDPVEPGRGVRGVYFYGAVEDTFRNNRWTIIDSTLAGYPVDCGQRVSLRFRDRSTRNYFFRDSLLVSGRCGWVQMSSQSGTYPACTNGDQRFDECYFSNTANGGGFIPFDYQYGMCRDTIQRCVFVTNFSNQGSAGIGTFQVHDGPVLIDHNTFFTTASGGSPLMIDPGGSFAKWAPGAELIATNNIFYMPNGSASSGAGAFYRTWAGVPFTADHNLYADYGRIAASGDRSIQFSTGCTGASGAGCTAVSSSQPGTGSAFYGATGQDGNSLYGSPGFVDSSLTRFDPSLLATSLARGRGAGGSDIGAIPFAGPDATAPAAVGGFATGLISDQNLTLSWTAPGDDGQIGTANAYEMRRSTAPLDDASFGSATLVSGVPAPAPAGTVQTLTQTGLTPGTTYYYGIRARDEAGNWSPIRYLNAPMSATDRVPSAPIDDFKVGP